MIGTILWNLAAGALGAALIFMLSYGHNPLATAGMRTLYSFIIMFAITFAVRWLLHRAFVMKETDGVGEGIAGAAGSETGGEDDQDKGQSIDLITPLDDPNAAFSPLTPPKLASVKTMNAEQMAKTLKSMSEQ